jgi:hypothetical protein
VSSIDICILSFIFSESFVIYSMVTGPQDVAINGEGRPKKRLVLNAFVDVVNVFMAELGCGVLVFCLSDWAFAVLTIGNYNSMGETPGNRDFS